MAKPWPSTRPRELPLTCERLGRSSYRAGKRRERNWWNPLIRLAGSAPASPHVAMKQIINSIRRYQGAGIPGLTGRRVVVLAVHRGDYVLGDDTEIGRLVPSDVVEFSSIITEQGGAQRISWSTAADNASALGPVEGTWAPDVKTGVVVLREGGTTHLHTRQSHV